MGRSKGEGNLKVLAEAMQILTAKWPSAVVIEAQGTPSRSFAANAAEIDQWLYVAHVNHIPVMTALLPWRDGAFSSPQTLAQPWLEDAISPLPLKLELSEAVSLLHKAGYCKPFASVTLREPLTHPPQTEPSYFFGFPGHWYVAVGVLTGKVTPMVRSLVAL